MTTNEEYLSVREYAALLGIHPNTVRRSIKTGRINAFKVGSGKRSDYRIAKSEINRMAFLDLEKVIEKMIEKRIILPEESTILKAYGCTDQNV